MLLAFWNNPEFVRHRRADLRPARALSAAAIVAVICCLEGMFVWVSTAPDHKDYYSAFYFAVLIVQCVVLLLWVFIACTQSVVKERDQKTYDFQRTTRLTSAELMTGKLLGAPVAGYFVFLCFLPVALVLGGLAHVGLAAMLSTYLLVMVFTMLLGLLAIVLSMKVEKASTGLPLVGIFVLYIMAFASLSMREFPQSNSRDLMPGLAAVSPMNALIDLNQPGATFRKLTTAPFFGVNLPFIALTLMLHVMFGAWCVLMLVRNLKTDFDEIRLLSRWQLLGLVVFVNWLFYGFLNPQGYWDYNLPITAREIAQISVGLNLFAVVMVGLFSMTPTLYFRRWYRLNHEDKEGYLSENGPPWPWLLMAAGVGYMLLTGAAFALSRTFPLSKWPLREAAGWTVIGVVFILRDILFLQWLSLTRMKRAAVKGVLLLCLYYAGVLIVGAVLSQGTEEISLRVLALLTPFAAISDNFALWSATTWAGLLLQIAASVFLVRLTNARLARKAVSPPILAAAAEGGAA